MNKGKTCEAPPIAQSDPDALIPPPPEQRQREPPWCGLQLQRSITPSPQRFGEPGLHDISRCSELRMALATTETNTERLQPQDIMVSRTPSAS